MKHEKSLFEETEIVEVSIKVKASIGKDGLQIIDLDIQNKPMLSLVERMIMELEIYGSSKKKVARDFIERAISLDKNEVAKFIKEVNDSNYIINGDKLNET